MSDSNIPESVRACREAFAGQFMQPKFYKGESIIADLMDAGLDAEDDAFYCRLSADGYLDCTDWQGPFETIDEAANELIRLYADW